jgi:RNA polymerase sigma-70 factor, ECF subfamily
VPGLPSLDRLVRENLPATLRFATRLAGDIESGEELVQEALLRAVRRWGTFRGEAEFRTWLFRIVINVFRDRLRASKSALMTTDEQSVELADQPCHGPAAWAAHTELSELIAREVSRLPPRQREVLTLIVFEELSADEVSTIVGISIANVYSTLSAARARLKTRLEPYLGSVEK